MTDVLFELNPLPTWIYDAQTRLLLDANAAFLTLLGLERSALQQLHLPELQPEDPAAAPSTAETHALTISTQSFRIAQGAFVRLEVREQGIEHLGTAAVLAVGQVLENVNAASEPPPNGSSDPAALQAEIARLKLFENIVMHTNDAVLVTEAEPIDEPGPRIVYVNEAFCKMTGYGAEEVLGKSPRLLQGPFSDFAALKKMGDALRKWQTAEVTTINYKKNGEPFWVNFSVTPIANSSGWFTHWIAIERDVTKSIELAETLTKAKETAEDNERKMKEAQRLARLGSWYYDFLNQISFWSEETFRIWGVDPQRGIIPFEEHESLIHPKDWPRFNDVITHAIANGIPYKMELDLLGPDGSIKTVNTIGSPIFNEQQQLIAFEGTTQDISDRTAIENELRAAKDRAERMQYVISEASRLAKIGHLDHDFCTNTISWSEYVYQLFELAPTAAALTDEQSAAHFDRVSQERLAAANRALLTQGLPFDLELRLLNTAGNETFVRQVMQPVFNEAHELIGKRGIVQNITEQVHLQELNRDVARMVKMGSWRVDMVENTVYWSEQVHLIHGTDPKTYVPTLEDGIRFYRNDFHEPVRQAVASAIQNGKSWDFEAVIVTAQNKEVWIRSIGDAELVAGECVGIFGGLQDIHEKKMAELALEASLRELQDYKFSLDQSAIIAFTDAHGVITDVNDNFCRISGYAKEELIGHTHRMVGSQYHPPAFFKELWKTISSGKVWRGEIKNKSKQGEYYWVDTTIVPFLNQENRPKQYLAIRFDISQRKKAESEVLAAAERQSLATTSAKMGIWDWDVMHNTLRWDERMYTLYGKPQASFSNDYVSWEEGVHPDDLDRVRQELNDALNGVKDFHTTFRVVWPDQSVHHIEAHAMVKRDEEGRPIRVIGGNMDETERVNSKALLMQHAKDLERYNESLRTIAWTQSHVVRAPLSRILAIVELIKQEQTESGSMNELLQYLKVATEEMDEIVKKIIQEASQVSQRSGDPRAL